MAKDEMSFLDWLAIVFVTIGAIHVGTVQWFGFDIAKFLSFGMSWIEVTLKTLIGLSGLWSLIFMFRKVKDTFF